MISHERRLGQEVESGNSCRIQLAVSSQTVHRSPAKMNSGTPASGLHPLHDARRRPRDAERVRQVVELRRLRLDGVGHLTQPRKIVDVGHRELGGARADARDELRRGERAAAELEEVGVLVSRADAEHGEPLLGEPRRGARQRRVRGIRIGQRPRAATPCRPCPTCGPAGRRRPRAAGSAAPAASARARRARSAGRSPSAGTT